MPYDRELADMIRENLAHLPSVREVNMFGGLSFLVNGKMVACASTQGDLLVRCDPAELDELLERQEAAIAQMGRRKMSRGWLRVAGEEVKTPGNLDFWIGEALACNAKETANGDGAN